jgi:hypothetical protein
MPSQVVKGGAQYITQVNLLKIICHARFAFVRFGVHSFSKDEADGCITVHWQIAGLSMLRLGILFFPKKLWKKDNMVTEAKIWKEGVSRFWVDGDGKLYRHVVDDKYEDKDRLVSGAGGSNLDKIKEKLEKLKPTQSPVPSPA